MHLIRQLTAYEMLAHEEDYATFLPAIEGWWRTSVPQENLSVPLVVGHLVVVDGVEAEHVMIQAVSTLLGMCLAVVYADGQADPQVRFMIILPPSFGFPHCRKHAGCWIADIPDKMNITASTTFAYKQGVPASCMSFTQKF